MRERRWPACSTMMRWNGGVERRPVLEQGRSRVPDGGQRRAQLAPQQARERGPQPHDLVVRGEVLRGHHRADPGLPGEDRRGVDQRPDVAPVWERASRGLAVRRRTAGLPPRAKAADVTGGSVGRSRPIPAGGGVAVRRPGRMEEAAASPACELLSLSARGRIAAFPAAGACTRADIGPSSRGSTGTTALRRSRPPDAAPRHFRYRPPAPQRFDPARCVAAPRTGLLTSYPACGSADDRAG